MGPYPEHKNNFASAGDTTSRVSPQIWSNCPFDEVESGFHPGYARHWEFVGFKPSTNVNAAEAYWSDGLMVFGSNGAVVTAGSDPTVGTGTVAANAFGTVAIGSDGDDEGCVIRQPGAPIKLSGPNSAITARSGRFWFEWRGKVSTVSDVQADCYVGLVEDVAATATVPITATGGTLADKNLVGFHRRANATSGNGALIYPVYKADGQTVAYGTTTQAITADTYVKLGLIYEPTDNTIKWFGNGLQLLNYAVLATQGNPFPNDILMGAVIAILNAAGSISPTITSDWMRICQIPYGT